MTRTKVTSTLINSVGYDPAKELLEVEFANGAVWHYHNVPVAEHEQFVKSPSLGSYFHANIKTAYKGTKYIKP